MFVPKQSTRYSTLALVVFAAVTVGCTSREVRPPSIAGQSAPDEAFQLDFSKRYDILVSFSYSNFAYSEKSPTTWLRSCKILGFTGKTSEQNSSWNENSGVAYAGSGRGSFFNSWLVLEYPDGRQAFIPPGIVKAIEESATQEEEESATAEQ